MEKRSGTIFSLLLFSSSPPLCHGIDSAESANGGRGRTYIHTRKGSNGPAASLPRQRKVQTASDQSVESLHVPGSVKRQPMQRARMPSYYSRPRADIGGAPGPSHLAGSVAAAGECVRGGRGRRRSVPSSPPSPSSS